MSIHNLDAIFSPKRIAVIGASNTQGSVGYTVLRNLITAGFKGVVYPINPKHESVQGIQAYKQVADTPAKPDMAVVCTPGKTVPGLVDECGQAGVRGMVILSAGFGEVGEEGKLMQQEILTRQKNWPGLRIIGPNCLGIMVPSLNLNASFAGISPKPGNVAFISQSGALCTSVLDWASEQNIGFSHFVSIGNMLDVSFAHLIDYFGQSENAKSIIMYIESISNARQFMSAARAFARSKPIIAYKAGRFAESAAAAASHTGALAGEDDVYDAAFQRAGIERVFEIKDMFECASLLARHRLPRSQRLAIVTNAGGPGVMATDALIERRGKLAEIAPQTIEKLNEFLPAAWSHGNPIDILGDAPPTRYAQATAVALDDKNVDAVLVILTPQAMTDPLAAAEQLSTVAAKSSKPILAAWMGGPTVAKGVQHLNQSNIPTYDSPEEAVGAFMHLNSYARNLETLYETPREVPVLFDMQLTQRRHMHEGMLMHGNATLSEIDAKQLLHSYDIPTTLPIAAASADAAAQAASDMGYPVVLKIHSEQITHKTDVGGVMLNLRDADEVKKAFDEIVTKAKEHVPDARIDGVTVQPMFKASNSMEMILGAKQDPTFGSVIMVGAGGVAAEVYREKVLGLPPLNESLARRMLESLRTWPLMEGYRGRPGVDIDALIEVLIRFSYLIADHPQITELDINPLIVYPEGVKALDARVMVDHSIQLNPERPYQHLAILPYPEQYQRSAQLKDGTPVLLRPIKPEDEPIWHDLVESCSAESIRFRFFSLIKSFNHDMASRYCCIDYEREMALVAEARIDGKRQLLGVARLIAELDYQSAEYAVIVADKWQGRGLGTLLTDFSLEIARAWKVKRVTARTMPENHRMIRTFKGYGFEMHNDLAEQVVAVTKTL